MNEVLIMKYNRSSKKYKETYAFQGYAFSYCPYMNQFIDMYDSKTEVFVSSFLSPIRPMPEFLYSHNVIHSDSVKLFSVDLFVAYIIENYALCYRFLKSLIKGLNAYCGDSTLDRGRIPLIFCLSTAVRRRL